VYGNLIQAKKVMKIKLLILANNFEASKKGLEDYFDEVDKKSLADVLVDTDGNVLIDGEEITEWDSVYIDSEPKAFNYLRVLLETLEHKDIQCNLESTSIAVQGKKPFLFSVLSDKGVNIPDQVAISTEKGLTEIERELDFPLLAKKYSSFELAESQIFEGFDDLKAFSELSEHGNDFIMIQEYKEDDIFDILYVDDSIISLKLEASPWDKAESASVAKKYHSISGSQKKSVKKAVNSLGANICHVRLCGDEVIDIDSRPDLVEFKEKSGKNVFGRVADALKEDDN